MARIESPDRPDLPEENVVSLLNVLYQFLRGTVGLRELDTSVVELPGNPTKAEVAHTLYRLCIINAKHLSALVLRDVEKCEPFYVACRSRFDIYRGKLINGDVAIKQLHRLGGTPIGNSNMIFRELITNSMLHHQNVLPLLGVIESLESAEAQPRTCIVAQWQGKGDIMKYAANLEKENQIVPIHEWLTEIATALAYVHGQGVVHGNVCAKNIEIGEEDQVLLTNFDLSALSLQPASEDSNTLSSLDPYHLAERCAAPEWLATLVDETMPKAGSPMDIYAFASFCVEYYSCSPPFEGTRKFDVINAVIRGERPPFPRDPVNKRIMPATLWPVIQNCWRECPAARPTAAALVQELQNMVIT